VTEQPTEPQASWIPEWVQDAVFYQVFPDRFARSGRVDAPGPLEPWDSPPTVYGFKGGDLLGIVDHLDHIQALGANALYLNPIFQSASNHRYHTYDYLAVDPLLGGDAALRELLDACHARGMRVVLDGVFNHASRGFWPFNHVMETGAASPYVDWFFFDRGALAEGRPIRAYPNESVTVDLSEAHPDWTAGEASMARFGYQAWWGLPALPKLNTDHPAVRAYLLDVAEHWIRFGADGWRLDVAEEVPDAFWREFRVRVKAIDADAYIVAEIWYEKPEVLRGDQYDALMNYPLGAAITSFVGAGRLDRRVLDQHFTIAQSVRDEDGPTFAGRLDRALTAYPPEVMAAQLNLLDSHDTPRFLSMVGDDRVSLKLAVLIQMTVPGAPSIYYGDEIGMAGELDPRNRGAFPWDHPDGWDRDLLAAVSGATALRHAHPVFRRGSFRVLGAEGSAVAYERVLGEARAVVAVNAGDGPATLTVELQGVGDRPFAVQRWPSGPSGLTADTVAPTDGRLTLELAARDGAVLLAG
jgi:cyclomaltodextrinase / maltogenic alpha-amylase / neopullulanase